MKVTAIHRGDPFPTTGTCCVCNATTELCVAHRPPRAQDGTALSEGLVVIHPVCSRICAKVQLSHCGLKWEPDCMMRLDKISEGRAEQFARTLH